MLFHLETFSLIKLIRIIYYALKYAYQFLEQIMFDDTLINWPCLDLKYRRYCHNPFYVHITERKEIGKLVDINWAIIHRNTRILQKNVMKVLGFDHLGFNYITFCNLRAMFYFPWRIGLKNYALLIIILLFFNVLSLSRKNV